PGAALLAQVPGVRTAVCALVAACATVIAPVEAALAGTAWAALASERAAQQSAGPASFRIALIDALSALRGDEIANYLNLGD
ncbi:MAG: hydroxyethylthiazole kinase, partial [Propioniciclava sp.]